MSSQRQAEAPDVFYLSLEEAKAAMADKYQQVADRYEQRYPKHKGLA
jgi:hypothetical protein